MENKRMYVKIFKKSMIRTLRLSKTINYEIYQMSNSTMSKACLTPGHL